MVWHILVMFRPFLIPKSRARGAKEIANFAFDDLVPNQKSNRSHTIITKCIGEFRVESGG